VIKLDRFRLNARRLTLFAVLAATLAAAGGRHRSRRYLYPAITGGIISQPIRKAGAFTCPTTGK
jgi:hypothetical protein